MKTAKSEYLSLLPLIQEHNVIVASEIKNGTQQVNDHIIYSVKNVASAKNFDELFKTDDDIAVGTTNVAQAKLPKDKFFVATHVRLVHRMGNTGEFGIIPPAIRNGEITIEQENRPIVAGLLMEAFNNVENIVATGDTNVAAGTEVTYSLKQVNAGLYELACPKMLLPEKRITVRMNFAEQLSADDQEIRLEFVGAWNERS